ncbi:response regulator [Pontibacter rugosus]|uniref:Response regulator n=1 Tax=Pontibacter rugosus TaxID=1745966 RepID=A0ABW3SST3_9BACT
MIKVIVTEDHIILRQGLRLLLEKNDEIEVIGEASNGKELLEMLERSSVDIVLMDINMPVMDGFEATKKVREQFPDVKVIALSMLDMIPYVQKMLDCGASGYLLKTTGKDELHAAIKLVASGNSYICGSIAMKMLNKPMNADEQQGEKLGEQIGLSKRELEVLALIAEGFTNAEIADKLFNSKRTVETHRQNILEKTQAKNTANLIKYAYEHKLIALDNPE